MSVFAALNECMDDEDNDNLPTTEWRTRLKRVRKENEDLYMFVKDGEDSGAISKVAKRASFAASVDVMRRGGIIQPQLSGEGVSDDVLCTVVAQAIHEAKVTLLRFHPELKEAMDQAVPSSRGGRVP